MFCPNCGTQLDDDSKFCHGCGNPIEDDGQPAGQPEGGADGETRVVAEPAADAEGGSPAPDETRVVETAFEDDRTEVVAGIDFGEDPAPDSAADAFASGGPASGGFAGPGTTMVAPDGAPSATFSQQATAQPAPAARQGGGKTVAAVAAIAVVAIAAVALIAFFMMRPQDAAAFTVQYETDGGTAVAAVEVEEGAQVTSPSNPTKSGYEFAGWYSNPERTDPVTFPFEAEDDVVLYAKWEEKAEPSPSTSSSSTTSSSSSATSPSQSTSASDRQAIAQSGSYAANGEVIPDSASSYLSRSDLSALTDDQLAIGMNEIWARHGRLFKNEWLQSYFDSKSWYTGTIAADDFLSKYTPTAIEDANSKLISEILTERGYDVNKAHPN